MGWWSLKPEQELHPYDSLRIQDDTLHDFITYWVEDGYELSIVDIEHIYNSIRDGYVQGQINDWESEKLEVAN